MKSIKFLIGVGFGLLISGLLLAPTSCKNVSSERSSDAMAQESCSEESDITIAGAETNVGADDNYFNFRALPSGVFKEPALRESFDTIGYVCGKFGVSDNDTLYCIALGCSYYKDLEELDEYDAGYNIIDTYMFSSPSIFIPELYVTIPFLDNVQTMNLDCDGVDELIMFNDGYESVWSSCMAYSLNEGKWNLIQPVVGINTVYRTEHPAGAPYVSACENHPGYMYINEDKFLPEDDPTEVKTVQSLVKIELEPLILFPLNVTHYLEVLRLIIRSD